LLLKGRICRTKSGYTFTGSIRALPDFYNFDIDWNDPLGQRPLDKQLAALLGAYAQFLFGNPYSVFIDGAIPIEITAR
jgi:hypothetical protein